MNLGADNHAQKGVECQSGRPLKHNQQVWNNFTIKLKPNQQELARYDKYKLWCERNGCTPASFEGWQTVIKSIREY